METMSEIACDISAQSRGRGEPPVLPGGWPFLGHAPRLLRTPLAFLEHQRGYGDIVQFRLGRQPAYLLNTPDMTKELLTNRSDFVKGALFEKARIIIGNGLATAEGDFHRRQRRLMQPAFHREHITRYAATMRDVTLERIASWQDGHTIAPEKQFYDITTNIGCRCLFSTAPSPDDADEIISRLTIMVKGLVPRALLPVEWVFRLPTPGNRRFTDAYTRLHSVIDTLIARCRADGTDRDDVLAMLFAARDQDTGQGMTDQQIHDEMMTLLIGASETTATTLWWLFLMLHHHPRVENRIHTELDHVLGNRDPHAEDILKLDYLNRVITETMRLFPPIWLFPRRATTDTTISGYHIPAGTNVFWSPYVLHRDPRSFPEPTTFDPNRWLPDRKKNIPRDAYIPFGAGNRMCIGNTFALMAIPIIAATITRRWRLQPPPHTPIQPTAETILHPQPEPMTLTKRR